MSISNYLLKNNASQQNESLENINKLTREVKPKSNNIKKKII